jgi:hypothetical protein
MSATFDEEIIKIVKATEAAQKARYRLEIHKLINFCENARTTKSDREAAIAAFETVLRMMDCV